MYAFLHKTVMDNEVGSYITVAGVLLLVWLFRGVLARLIIAVFYRLIRRQTGGVDKKTCLMLLHKPVAFFLLIAVLEFSTDKLSFPSDLNIMVYEKAQLSLSRFCNGLLDIVFIISFFWICLRIIDFIATVMAKKADVRDHRSGGQLVLFFRDFIKVLVGMLGLIIILRMLIGHDAVSKIIGALGIGAAALALAAKESIENLIGSFIILFDKPFAIGDYVAVNNYSGNVEKIGLRSTRIRTDDKTYVTVPNSQMVEYILNNFTLRTQQRGILKLEIAANTPSDTLLQLLPAIKDILKGDKDVMDGFSVYLNDITRDAYQIQIFYNTPLTDWAPFTLLKDRVNIAIIRLLESRGVKLAKKIDL